MKKYLLMSVLALPLLSFAQWTKVSNTSKQVKEEFASLKEKQLFSLDKSLLKSKLQNAPEKFSGQKGVELLMPNAEGVLEKFLVWEYSNFTPEVQAIFPNIRSYMGIGVTDKSAYLRFTVSDQGVSSSTFRTGSSSFVEAYTAGNDVYAAYSSSSRILDQKD